MKPLAFSQIVTVFVCLGACVSNGYADGGPAATQPAADPTFSQLENIAIDHVNSTRLPDVLKPWNYHREIQITRFADRWEITWPIPKNFNGGSMTVFVNRQTLKAYHYTLEQ
ncbi:MAG: hypothetical protein JWM57_2477 [Phycisphaerales bacterium]|nr:hypothetical protein [Phycisphaerales bacterium]